jgi:hypothetical protein
MNTIPLNGRLQITSFWKWTVKERYVSLKKYDGYYTIIQLSKDTLDVQIWGKQKVENRLWVWKIYGRPRRGRKIILKYI